MWGADTLKSSSSSLTGESVKASSWCCSGTKRFLGHIRMALMAVSLQQHVPQEPRCFAIRIYLNVLILDQIQQPASYFVGHVFYLLPLWPNFNPKEQSVLALHKQLHPVEGSISP